MAEELKLAIIAYLEYDILPTLPPDVRDGLGKDDIPNFSIRFDQSDYRRIKEIAGSI